MQYPRKVYALQHNVTKKIYIGSSANLEARYSNHMSNLRKDKHINKDMQNDFNKYGEDYSLYILDTIQDERENRKEYEWMLKYKSNDPKYGYNTKDKNTTYKSIPHKEGLPELPKEDEED